MPYAPSGSNRRTRRLGRMSKESTTAYFEIQSRHFPGGTEETHEEPGRMVNVEAEVATFLTHVGSLTA
jgi:hypothetical protein